MDKEHGFRGAFWDGRGRGTLVQLLHGGPRGKQTFCGEGGRYGARLLGRSALETPREKGGSRTAVCAGQGGRETGAGALRSCPAASLPCPPLPLCHGCFRHRPALPSGTPLRFWVWCPEDHLRDSVRSRNLPRASRRTLSRGLC